ncbi:MAG TPA: multiheme c-type cytochrome, partial [Longimicrobiales bacterium]
MNKRIAIGVVLIAAVVIVGVLLIQRRSRNAISTAPFPPFPASEPTQQPVAEDFLGSQACATCHRQQYDVWRASTHGRAGGEPARDLLLRDFDGTPIRFRDATVTPRVINGRYAFDVQPADGDGQLIVVDGVVGGGHLVGGGTQGFFTRHADGTMRFLPFEIVRAGTAWFCNTSTRANRGWVQITPDMSLADCGDWPPVRVLGTSTRFASCQECHGSQIQLERTQGERPFATRYRELSINCESCHGPGRKHVQLVRAGSTSREDDVGMVSLATLDKDRSLEVCFRCHALKDALVPGYLPGRDLEQYYSLKLPLVGNRDLQPDGRTRTFAYQQGHLYSDCYLSGSMTCVDCHEPHGQGYRDVNGKALPSRFNDGQCTGCHASKAVNPQLHTHHTAASEGSRCVACHMPYLQQSDVGSHLRYARSDHTIPVPRPQWDTRMGVQLSCSNCHREMQYDALDRAVRNWYGELKPQRPLVVALADASDAESAGLTALLALKDTTSHTALLFNAIAQYLSEIRRADERGVPRRL